MSFSIGIVGFPNVGKSTLFKALTKKSVEIGNYPFTTINPNIGIVEVFDERLEKLANALEIEKKTFTKIEFKDIAGLVKGAHKGEGLGNQFLAEIKNCSAILMVLRGFEKEGVENVLGELNPQKEMELLRLELIMKDLESIENIILKLKKKRDKKLSLLEKIKNFLLKEKFISEMNLTEKEKMEIKEYQFLTQKPILYLLNVNSPQRNFNLNFPHIRCDIKEQEEICQFSKKELKELSIKPQLDQIILACYNILDLITFYTVAKGKEAKAWTLKKGKTAIEAASLVHSDFVKKFIKAEVINWEDLIKIKSWSLSKKEGKIKIVGKDYIVKDGDVLEFKI